MPTTRPHTHTYACLSMCDLFVKKATKGLKNILPSANFEGPGKRTRSVFRGSSAKVPSDQVLVSRSTRTNFKGPEIIHNK